MESVNSQSSMGTLSQNLLCTVQMVKPFLLIANLQLKLSFFISYICSFRITALGFNLIMALVSTRRVIMGFTLPLARIFLLGSNLDLAFIRINILGSKHYMATRTNLLGFRFRLARILCLGSNRFVARTIFVGCSLFMAFMYLWVEGST